MESVILRVKDIMRMYNISKTTVYELKKDEEFPRPVSLGARAKGYYKDEIDSFFRTRRLN